MREISSRKEARVETHGTPGRVLPLAEKRSSGGNRAVNMRPARRVATRQVISLMQPRRIHPTKCTSLRREGVVGGDDDGGGKKGGARRKKTKSTAFPLGRMRCREVHASRVSPSPSPLLLPTLRRAPTRREWFSGVSLMIAANYESFQRP